MRREGCEGLGCNSVGSMAGWGVGGGCMIWTDELKESVRLDLVHQPSPSLNLFLSALHDVLSNDKHSHEAGSLPLELGFQHP